VVKTIDGARRTLLVQAYSFTDPRIIHAIGEAERRGVDVRVILDKENRQPRYTGATYLRNAGVPVRIDDKVAIAHNKVMVIDGETVVTGSFNFTKAAEEHNAENLVVLKDRALAARYAENWDEHRRHSEQP